MHVDPESLERLSQRVIDASRSILSLCTSLQHKQLTSLNFSPGKLQPVEGLQQQFDHSGLFPHILQNRSLGLMLLGSGLSSRRFKGRGVARTDATGRASSKTTSGERQTTSDGLQPNSNGLHDENSARLMCKKV